METIIIVDDEKDIGDLLTDILSEEGYIPLYFSDTEEALSVMKGQNIDLAILDIWMDNAAYDGIKLLEIIKSNNLDIPVIMMSGHSNVDSAVKSLKIGACDYIEKPFTGRKILETVDIVLKMNAFKKKSRELGITDENYTLVGNSQYINNLRTIISKVASTSSRIMITGPSGSGKETIARLIHAQSGRIGEFIPLRTSFLFDVDHAYKAIFGTESSLGLEEGMLEKARNGTLFIDEVADLSIDIQKKILYFLQEKKFNHPNGSVVHNFDVRFISASSKDLHNEIRAQRLREDLFYRLSVIPMKTLPLVEHIEDIKIISKFIIDKLTQSMNIPEKNITEAALTVMQSYYWPGNIRQLKNVLELIILTSNADNITELDLPVEIITSTQFAMDSKIISMSLKNAREEFERQYIKTQLMRFGKNVTKTAEFIKMERSALYRKLRSLGLEKLIF